ncbi:BTB/POZ domain-containing protein 3-like [Paramacrobiotus metropolitanus]|uniref:BTB/POZ domain-containing protein 3-like n=1 Tax=Paramacrobiotus metropolitanus TaxID=2943436 RepID=UPI00244578DD|nr:BTB/POZ domain-containing protein 3-like [Paramacrobiotus metropolitanus]
MSQTLTSSSTDSGVRGKISNITDGVQRILVCGEMSDVQFAVGRDYGEVKNFPAHRVILSIRSDVFHTMFYGSEPENCTAPIEIPDVYPEGFDNMIHYVYTDNVKNLTHGNVFHTLGCADKYNLPLLAANCAEFILKDLIIDNCLVILESAVRYATAVPNILQACLFLIDASAKTIWESDQFCAIGEEALRIILQRDSLSASENTIYSSVDKWATSMCMEKNMDASSANRREILGETLFLIRFPLMTDKQLLDGPLKSGLLLQSEGWEIYKYKHATMKPIVPFSTKPRQRMCDKGVINYTVPEVRRLSSDCISSDSITVQKLLWSIMVEKNENDALGIFVKCSGPSDHSQSGSWKCQVAAEFRLLPWKAETVPIKRSLVHVFCNHEDGKDNNGYKAYISMKELLDPAKGYVNPSDFSMKLQVQLTADIPVGIE